MRSHRRPPTRLPHPWDSPGENTGLGCHVLLQRMKVKNESEVTQSCPTLSDPTDYSLPGSSIHGIFQTRVMEWGAIAFSSNHFILSLLKRSNKGLSSQSYGFAVVMYRCESDHKEGSKQNNWRFSMWCRRRFVRVSWTARKSYQSTLKKNQPSIFIGRLMLKVKLEYNQMFAVPLSSHPLHLESL